MQTTNWISVKDRLPDPLTDVIVYYAGGGEVSKQGRIAIAYLTFTAGWLFEAPYGPVTHWMPLPEPPQAEDDTADDEQHSPDGQEGDT